MKCPKCGYARKAREAVPETQCPARGIYYAKADPAPDPTAPPRIVLYSEPRASWGIGKTVALVAVIAGVYAFTPLSGLLRPSGDGASGALTVPGGRGKLKDADFSRSHIVMYSLTTCVYCAELRRKFAANNVPFYEYYLDREPARMEEMFAKLKDVGYSGGIGTPTLEVNGKMMPNNPPFDDIIAVALR